MKKLTIIAVAASMFAFTAGTASAQQYYGYSGGGNTRSPGIDRKQDRQEARIEQGFRSGALTKNEYRRLMAQQDEIRRLERRLKADGHLSRGERQRLHALLAEASRDIYDEKHDDQVRGNKRFGEHNGRYNNRRRYSRPIGGFYLNLTF